MSKLYLSDARHSKAAMILGSMSDDMIADIINLVQARGSNLIGDISSDKSRGLSPLAVFSRELISDDDFELVWVGFNTLQIASLRGLKSDFDFYESTLKNAFGLPSEMAASLAKTIETYDIIGVTAPGQPVPAWYSNLGAQIAEQVRKISNWSMDILHLPFENDQDQKYDIDFLYELRLLGKAVDELNARSRLMNAQASIAAGMGLFKPGDSGDVSSDPNYGAALVGDVFSPLLLSSLPRKIFGQFNNVAKMGRLASSAKAKSLTTAAGLSKVVPTSLSGSSNTDPGLTEALTKAMQGDFGQLGGYVNKLGSPGDNALLNTIKNAMKTLPGGGDVAEAIGDVYGEEVGEAWSRGDIADVMAAIGDLAMGEFTTGDPDLDTQIIGDVMDDISETGDLAYGDAEIGGLLKRARINAALRKGNRIRKRTTKKVAKVQKRTNEDARLANAKKRIDFLRTSREQQLRNIRPVIPEEEQFVDDEEFIPEQGWEDEGEFIDTESQLADFGEQ